MAERVEADLQEQKINCYFSNTRNIFLDDINREKTFTFWLPNSPSSNVWSSNFFVTYVRLIIKSENYS